MKTIENLNVSELQESDAAGAPLLAGTMEIIKGVKVKLEVRIGDAELTVDELMALKNGSVVKLTKPVTAPVELLLDNQIVALGSLVAADDNFGIQITDIKSR